MEMNKNRYGWWAVFVRTDLDDESNTVATFSGDRFGFWQQIPASRAAELACSDEVPRPIVRLFQPEPPRKKDDHCGNKKGSRRFQSQSIAEGDSPAILR
jgi:hypothetical protein